jgi:glycosyltransferase involved in cell wall biosynthesis
MQIVQNLNYGGAERLIFEMLRRSDQSGFESHVLILQYAGRFAAGLELHATVSIAEPMGSFSLLRPVSLARTIAAVRPDVVHTHSGVWYKAARAARMAGVPWLIHTDHGRAAPDPWLSRMMDGAASRHTDVVVAVSDAVAHLLRTTVVRWPERVRVIPNGVDVTTFLPERDDGALRGELGLAPNTPIIGSIGRLEPIKGYGVMVDAYAALRRTWQGDRPPILVVAGDGSERAALEQRAAAAGVADGVRWLGWRDDIHRLHAAFSLFSMSSHSEGTSVSLLEAMSAGLCPVVTDVGGNATVVGVSLRHRLVPPRDPDALAAAWGAAFRDAGALEADGRAARARVMESFTLDAMVHDYERLYRREDLPAGRVSA